MVIKSVVMGQAPSATLERRNTQGKKKLEQNKQNSLSHDVPPTESIIGIIGVLAINLFLLSVDMSHTINTSRYCCSSRIRPTICMQVNDKPQKHLP